MDFRPPREVDTRRRQWDEYDRELAIYHDRRTLDNPRGRSRSPIGEDGGRKRRRSLSPWERSHYERPRYGDEKEYSRPRDDYGHRRGGYQSYNGREGRGRAPPNPYDLDHPAQLKHFADWFRYTHPDEAAEEDRLDRLDGDALREAGSEAPKPRDGIRLRWEKYKKEFTAQQLTLMFDHHKKHPWFIEKYEPSEYHVNLRKRVRKQGWRGKATQFLLELEEGKFDNDILPLEESIEPSGEESPSKVSVEAKSEPPKAADAKNGTHEEDMNFGLDAEEDHDHESKIEAGSKLTLDAKASSRNDEISVMPEGNEILIRTLPPDISRVKLEEACSSTPGFVHLALGDPSPRKHFYRAGWIKFLDSTDMEKAVQDLADKKVDGFKLHVTHSTRPFNTRARIAPEVASRPERILKDLEQIKQLVAVLEGEAAALRQFRPSEVQPQQQMEVDGESAPNPSTTDDVPISPDKENEVEPEPSESAIEAIERRVEKLLAESSNQDSDGVIDPETKRAAIALDLYRAYLRAAYNTCYYCVTVTDHLEELQRKCAKHVRKPLTPRMIEEIQASRKPKDSNPEESAAVEVSDVAGSEQGAAQEKTEEKVKEKPSEPRDWKRNDERWLDWLDSKLALLLKKGEVDPREYGGKDDEDELSKSCEAHIKQEDEGKYRCKLCNKLFKAVGFVEKHIANKHPELIKNLDELPFFNNFALDPHRIQPSAHLPPPPGNGVGPPPQAYGLKTNVWAGADYAGGHGRGSSYGGHHPPYPNPPPPHAGYGPPPPYFEAWGGGGYGPIPAFNNAPYPPHHDPMTMAPMGGRRLSDRLGGFVEHMDGLPVKPMAGPDTRRAPPPPPDAREDPRALGGRKVSYHDIDKAAAGDDVNIQLSY